MIFLNKSQRKLLKKKDSKQQFKKEERKGKKNGHLKTKKKKMDRRDDLAAAAKAGPKINTPGSMWYGTSDFCKLSFNTHIHTYRELKKK